MYTLAGKNKHVVNSNSQELSPSGNVVPNVTGAHNVVLKRSLGNQAIAMGSSNPAPKVLSQASGGSTNKKLDSFAQSLPPAGPSPVVTPATPAATALQPSLSLSNDTYVDSPGVSLKTIRFNVSVPTPLDNTKIALVNKVQGHAKKANGTFYKATLYGSPIDINFPTMRVDSVDSDPVYWSNSAGRWNYNSTTAGFSATDAPGPFGRKGDDIALKFRIGVYWMDEVPTTTTGSISATAIQELDWQVSVKADPVTGTISHPSI